MTTADETVPLRDYVERIFDEQDKRFALERANNDQRLGKLNELREEVTRDRAQFVQKPSYDALYDRVTKVENTQSRMIGIALALITVSGLLGFLLTKVIGK